MHPTIVKFYKIKKKMLLMRNASAFLELKLDILVIV